MNVVTLPYDPDWLALEWAKEHCGYKYITNDARMFTHDNELHYQVNYYFSDEQSALMFRLRWA